jgi:hypothetical protein
MKTLRPILAVSLAVLLGTYRPTPVQAGDAVKEVPVAGPNGVTVKVRMEGPYTAEVPLQVVCYFKYTPEGAKRMSGAPVELDKRLGGVIAALRERGEFLGDDLETLLLTPPSGSIPAKALLLIGLGDEATLSLDKMEEVGRVAVREAARLGVRTVAFAPLIRDQGNSKFGTGDVAAAVLRGAFLAYDTEKRLEQQGLGKAYTLDAWQYEAGPAYFDETTAAAQKAARDASAAIAARPSAPYASGKR